MQVRNPRTGEFDYKMRAMADGEVADAAAKLRAAQPEWAALSLSERIDALGRFADAIEANMGDIAAALSTDTGRKAISTIEVMGVVGNIRRWINIAPEIIEKYSPQNHATSNPGVTNSTRLIPFQLFGAISPWNFPFLLSMIDAVPALLAGCAALIKPSEITPRFIEPFRKAIDEVPELAKALILVTGDAATGQAVVNNVDYICFTGSVATGRKVAEAAGRAFIPANLELGGKDPMIILASTDPERAAKIALRSSVVGGGQACQSIERIYVAREIHDAFVANLVTEAEKLRFNYPDIGVGELGPFIFAPQGQKVVDQINEAKEMGARVLTGGELEILGGGTYLRPTVVTDVTPDMSLMRDETFGPVMPVVSFDDVADAIMQANDVEYGLSAAVLAATADEAEAVGVQLQAGAVSINDGGLTSMVSDAENTSLKASGLGPSRMGESGLMRFFHRQALMRQNGDAVPIQNFSEENFG